MGQCTSTKSTQINNVLYVNQSTLKQKKRKSSNSSSPLHCAAKFFKMEKNTKTNNKCPVTRGQMTRFGFKKPPPVPQTQAQLPSIPASTDDFTVVQETIQPLVINSVHAKNGTPLPSRGKKDLKPVNRFGFVPPAPQLSNKVSDVSAASKENTRPMAKTTAYRMSPAGTRSLSETRYNKTVELQKGGHCTAAGSVQNLAKPIVGGGDRLSAAPSLTVYYKSNESLAGSPSADKLAKTVANNHMMHRSQNKGHSFGFPNSTVKLQKNDSKMEIQQLEQSPGAATKFRHQERARPMEMVFPSDRNGGGVKKFELRDVQPAPTQEPQQPTSGAVFNQHARLAERIRQEVVSPAAGPEMTRSVDDELSSEEKQRRDKKDSEKFHNSQEDGSPDEDLWGGPGEAMALEDEFPCPTLAAIDQSPEDFGLQRSLVEEAMNPPLRSVLLTIEDPTFAALAALSKPSMIDDEQPPDSPDISCSSPSSIEPLPPPPANITGSKSATPQSPGTPSHASNSLSSDAKDRDFLIDDEIADQPGLVFDGERHRRRLDEHEVRTSKRIAALAGEVSQALANLSCSTKDDLLRASNTSLASTLSPCESLASDDLMVDFEQSDFDDLDRDEAPFKSEVLKQSDKVIKEWSTLLNSYPRLASGKRKPSQTAASTTRSKIDTEPKLIGDPSSSQSPSSSPIKHTAKIKNASPVADDNSEDSGVGKGMYHSMYQDFVYIKSGLRLLQKVLQESADLEPPLQSSGEEGLELEDLRRQILLLELQNQEKDRKIAKLEEELKTSREAKRPPSRNSSTTAANKATQTDKIRPLSTTFFHNSPNNATASIVSLNEASNEQHKTHRVNHASCNNLRFSSNNYPTNRKFV